MSAIRQAPAEASAQGLEAFWQQLAQTPYAFDLYHLLRWLDARGDHTVLLGRAARSKGELLRLGQEPSMAFAPSTLASVKPRHGPGLPKVSIFSFGLFGPNGPLPLHLTEFARDRQRNYGDDTLSAFADIFHHRLILLFYRAWADAQATASLDRPDTARFDRHVASLIHLGLPAQRHRDTVPDHVRYFFAGHQVRLSRNPEGLLQMLRGHLQIPVELAEYMPHWIGVTGGSRACLTSRAPALAGGALLGLAVRDVQSSFRLILGPLSWSQYRQFLPLAAGTRLVVDWVRHYLGVELQWDLLLRLAADEVPALRLGEIEVALGWGSWLGRRLTSRSADDLLFCPEDWRSRSDRAHRSRAGSEEVASELQIQSRRNDDTARSPRVAPDQPDDHSQAGIT
ncbi:type VI secretion system baseplate subunit TssG [Frateuria aurantia]|uniref:Type VI secretion protein, VC_A0111 family n=1 Tax=Frateuria aurantia (strain ATCC 33424 / DSM 6220 / KCTC 2777 / LMG 1558 / NBRC 3245 / NCIMB 13370) TaxID=767434 RepID=H8KZF2_FRAAD|nr:type VI secretion system baseplate subunit TssG [Frateuria aurantia]AFC86194.1 type VI secretion protein, VC_A0111 family [Frateuria aurantia DSM 6220]